MAQKQVESDDCIVAVTIEMGHRANFRTEPSPEGFSHDWTVFVRGFEGGRLEYFVEKVVFKLHKTFRSPTRVIADPPFRVTESGYAGFTMPIEIYFKNKQTPRKIVFSYDLFLNIIDCPPINHVRYEKLKFKNPTPDFKAMLIKAGGVELREEYLSNDLLASLRPQHKALPDVPKDKENDKEKMKKNKSKRQLKSASPAPSLSSLSPMSSDNEDSHATPPPPPPVKREKEPSSRKKESSSSSQPKQDSSSSHKDKSKHRSSSSHSSHRERPDKEASHKSHKHKDKTKERDRSSSHKDKDAVKKDKDVDSQKVVKENFESRKEREGSHSSGKSSTSSFQVDNKVVAQVSHKEREKSVPSKDKDTTGSSKEKLHSSSKEKEKLPKEKHSSHKEGSNTSHSEPKKVKEDVNKEKISKDIAEHHKSHRRPVESADDIDKKKLKRSSSVASTDEKTLKVRSSSGKEKHVSRDNKEKEPSKEVKESKPSSSDKSKQEKSHHSEKQRHSHSSETKQKESSVKRSETPQKHESMGKSESFTHSERLAMTANFQPQLLLSPLKSKSDEEESPVSSPLPVDKTELKSSQHHSSPDSPSSAVSFEDKSDHEVLDPQADEKHIVSGLTDSESDSEEEAPFVKSQQKDLKSILNKQSQQTTEVSKSSSQKIVRRGSAEEKQKKAEYEPTEEKKYSTPEKKANFSEPAKSKSVDRKVEYPDADGEHVNTANSTDSQNCNGLDILAPNGMSVGELIAINEQIEKAQIDSNYELLERVAEVIGETDDFDISDVSLSFDICSVDKTVVLQIQALLREY